MSASTRMSVLYFVVGQAGWFACVLSAAHDASAVGVIASAILLIAHLIRVPRPLEECKFLAFVVLLGAIWESVLVRVGLLSYPGGTLVAGFAPAWIVALWSLFGGQFNTCYTWLKRRPMVAAVLGAIAGPLSFRAGASLGAVHFMRPLPATIVLAVGWAIILPLLTIVSRQWDGVRTFPQP